MTAKASETVEGARWLTNETEIKAGMLVNKVLPPGLMTAESMVQSILMGSVVPTPEVV